MQFEGEEIGSEGGGRRRKLETAATFKGNNICSDLILGAKHVPCEMDVGESHVRAWQICRRARLCQQLHCSGITNHEWSDKNVRRTYLAIYGNALDTRLLLPVLIILSNDFRSFLFFSSMSDVAFRLLRPRPCPR